MRNLSILIALTILFSCQGTGFIPPSDLSKAFYPDIKPDLQWRSDLSMFVNYGNYRIVDDLMLIYGKKRIDFDETIKAYQIDSGKLLWEIDISNHILGKHIHETYLFREGQTLYFVDLKNGRTFLINAENGNLIEIRSAGINPINGFTAYPEDRYFYHLDYKARGEFELIKYDILNDELTKLISINDYSRFEEISPAVYHKGDNMLYLLANIDYNRNVLFELNLNSNNVHELWSWSDSGNIVTLPRGDLLLIDDIFIFENDYGEVYGVNRTTGQLQWTSEAGNYLERILKDKGISFLQTRYNLIQIDHDTGGKGWETSFHNINPDVSFHPVENLILGANENETHKAAIYDLTNGQKLVEWETSEDEESSIRYITYHEATNSIFICTSTEVLKYDWPLP